MKETLEEYEANLRVDMRRWYGVSLDQLGTENLSYVDAILIIEAILADTQTYAGAKKAGWKYPMSDEAAQLAILNNNFIAANSDPKKKREPIGFPWSKDPIKTTFRVMTREEADRLLKNYDNDTLNSRGMNIKVEKI